MFLKKINSEERIIKKSEYWDGEWYKNTYLYNTNIDPVRHYLTYGWKRGYDPSKYFDTQGYLSFYPDVKDSGINPLLHYERFGKREQRYPNNFEYNLIKNSKYFDEDWYKNTYLTNIEIEPATHYLSDGWKKGYSPSKKFSTLRYLALNYDVRRDMMNPLLHYEKYGRFEVQDRLYSSIVEDNFDVQKYIKLQNERILKQYSRDIKNLIVFLVPAVDDVCGGLMSICSIARVTAQMKKLHNSEVIIATVPASVTFSNYTKFEAGFDIFRFGQIFEHFTKLEKLMIHIPENFIIQFVSNLSVEQITKIQEIDQVQFNILNQNNLLMPRPADVDDFLRKICPNLSMTVAHRKYCTSQMRTSYNMPIHLFSASNLVEYFYCPYEEKDDLLVYSPDDHPYKEQILNKIKKEFPNITLLEIRNMSYLQYRKVISRAKWMITFGEGLDGYFVESIRSGAIAFACFNNVFFDERFADCPNVYSSVSTMLQNICNTIRAWDNAKEFKYYNDLLRELDSKEYNDDEYIENIKQFYLENYTFPIKEIYALRECRVQSKPLISVVMATYNGEAFLRKQLVSLVHLNYPNYEIVISDDGSSDRTLEIINHFQRRYSNIRLYKNEHNHGLNGNFANGIRHAAGAYIALCDQDDIWYSNKLSCLLERIDDFDIVYGNVRVIDDRDNYHSSEVMHDAYEYSKHRSYELSDYIHENVMLGCTSLIKKSFLDTCITIPDNVIYHDWWFVLNAVLRGQGICYVDMPVIQYRQHNTNTAKSTYDDLTWFKRKADFDKVILKEFCLELSNNEKELVVTDYYWNQIRGVLRFSAPNYLEEFFTSNKYGFNQKMYEELLKIDNLEDL